MSRVNSFFTLYGKVLGLLATMAVGMAFPQLHALSFLIQYLLMLMLFFSFLDIELKPRTFHRSVLWILLANVAVAFLSYALLVSLDATLALTAFMTAIAPTAIAAPVIMSFIQGKIEYVVAAVLVTNVSSAIIVPLALPVLLGGQAEGSIQISVWEVLQPVLIVMFVPLILARLVAHLSMATQQFIRKGKSFSFLLWLVNLFLISANASNFFRNEDANSVPMLIVIAVISLVLCIVNFGVGALLGGPRNWQEASQSLGQKNLSFVIWIALTFINPLVAMGPTFYILYHHLYNSWSIYRFEKRRHLL
jgi:BASS family bile acid:Na+ symporter